MTNGHYIFHLHPFTAGLGESLWESVAEWLGWEGDLNSWIGRIQGGWETQLEVEIEIIDDDDWEPDEEFFLKIAIDPNAENKDIKIGKKNIMTVMILNDDEPGTFGFDKRGHFVKVINFH